ncbi:MAG: MFS transporter [Gammaproteobacteria bacterium]|nr:MFS transporter [Gammaproteobacteria bacterium]
MNTALKNYLRSPEMLLMLMASAVPLSFATWSAMINNLSVEMAGFSGREIGILQSIREIPGFLAFAVIFVLLLMREQTLAIVSLLLMGIGTALTGYLPSVVGLYCTTLLMSFGFHYYEAVQSSLSLQWIDKERTALVLGRILGVGSFTSLVAFGLIYAGLELFSLSYRHVLLAGGGLTVVITLVALLSYPAIASKHRQHKQLILRRRYWLYYALVFFSGARRQIFVVFAGFMMVEKFGYSAANLTLLFLVNCAINIWLAPVVGRLVGRWGDRNALVFEYLGLIVIFTSYAFVNHAGLAAVLYILDHMFFALAIAIKTYFQKIADPRDFASSAGVSFTINHVAAVLLPAALGLLWLSSPALVFLCGTGFAVCSLILSLMIPVNPAEGREFVLPAPMHSSRARFPG